MQLTNKESILPVLLFVTFKFQQAIVQYIGGVITMGPPGQSLLALLHTEANSRENYILKKKEAIQREILVKLHILNQFTLLSVTTSLKVKDLIPILP